MIRVIAFADQDRLRAEKEALEALLRPPSISKGVQPTSPLGDSEFEDGTGEDRNIRESLRKGSSLPAEVNSRVKKIVTGLGPTVDTFAGGVHKINQYRIAAEETANQVLATCAEKLTEREVVGRKQALGSEEYNNPRRDLSSVLRGLSKTDNR